MQEKPWFVRRGSGWCMSVRPSAPAGWLITTAYSLAMTLMAFFIERFEGHLAVWFVLVGAATVLFVTAACRLSVPAPPGSRGCGGGGIY
ncbi:hypothetical protein ACFQ1E_09605 [Sphingomonas canadensis]|uniref:YiaAB two helix domain-containing protein n=1 Tax=Sphingomonas canadensis TaxID=1219257 RepID=A0ABW3H723_9SPHN|nr:hypothetical protein [Sphingomonas canadensis]MCW3836627.1 hypothetical protein [Sphingomonas canadensis]